jgi:hypothetical protein
MAKKKSGPNFPAKSGVRKKHRPFALPPNEISKGWAVIGYDTALSSIAGAGIAYDAILKRMRGPVFTHLRFGHEDDYFSRLEVAAKSHEITLDLLGALGVTLPLTDIFICQEEPFPAHTAFTRKGAGQALKQQAEISGAFLGGLVRWGFTNIVQVSNQHWRGQVAKEISDATGEDVTTYPAKWQSGELAARFGCTPKDSGKFRVVQWTHDVFEPWIAQQGGSEIPHFPHMINSSKGKIPKPETSRAKPYQPDDRLDALAIMNWLRVDQELRAGD